MNAKKIIFLIIFLISKNLYANIGSDLTNYFNGLGYSSNVTNPAAFQGQQAGYYSFGSISARTRVRDLHLLNITLPSFRGGCGGIDLYGGSISFLNFDEVKKTFKSVVNNSANVALTLALETITPMIAENAKYWRDIIERVNNFSINSCQLAQYGVKSAWETFKASQQQVCREVNASDKTNRFPSYLEASQDCGYHGKIKEAEARAKADPRYKDLIMLEGNVVWKALKKRDFLTNDTELAELFMSLSGSIILINNNDEVIQKPLNPLAHQQELIEALFNGKKVKIYRCDETVNCLNPHIAEITIDESDAFKSKISKILNNIAQKLINDEKLNESEESLITSANTPILNVMTVMAAFLKSDSIPNIDLFSELIATEIVYSYLQDALTIVQSSLSAIPLSTELTKPLLNGIERSMAALRDKRSQLNRQTDTTMHLITQTQSIERMLIGEFSSELASTISWAKGLN